MLSDQVMCKHSLPSTVVNESLCNSGDTIVNCNYDTAGVALKHILGADKVQAMAKDWKSVGEFSTFN